MRPDRHHRIFLRYAFSIPFLGMALGQNVRQVMWLLHRRSHGADTATSATDGRKYPRHMHHASTVLRHAELAHVDLALATLSDELLL